MIVIDKVWGREIWIVNCEKYCGKILELNGNYCSSYHCHKIKQETFYCLEGSLVLKLENEEILMVAGGDPITIFPKQFHSFRSDEGAKMLEISTKHSDDDVVRKSMSHRLSG